MLGIAWELGYVIVIPLVLFAFGGRFLDTLFGSKPLFFLAAILAAIIISTTIVCRKVGKLLEDIPGKEKKP